MAEPRNQNKQVTMEMDQYNKALDAWKAKKPNSMDKSSYAGFPNVGAAINAWRAEKPQKSDFTNISTPSSAPKPSTPSTPVTKESEKIDKDIKSVKQNGVSDFVRNLLPTMDRLSPSQRMKEAGKTRGQILRKRLGR